MTEPATPSWWSRHWKWFVPVGCLSLILLFCAFIAVVVGAASGMMKSSDAYKEGLARAQASAAVSEALGSPIAPGWFTSGSVNLSGGSGEAHLEIPISGPKGKGTLYVEATKSAGEWSYSKIEVVVAASGARIDLLDGP
jgi:hypothetical protein